VSGPGRARKLRPVLTSIACIV